MRRKLLVSSWTLLVLALVFTASAVAGNGGIAPPGPQSPNASGIRDLYWILLGITGVVFVIVEVSLLVFIVRFRSRGRSREVEGPQIRGHNRLELIWTAIPVVILAFITGLVFYKLDGIDTAPAQAAGEHLTVRVEGRQFYWRYVYPNGAVSVNELVVPVGRVIDLDVTAPVNDVIHSWWIPQLGGKIDAIPGKTNHTWFLAERAGTYRGQCAEFCGIQHALMLARVRAVDRLEYEAWVARRAAAAGQDLGQQTFAGACAPCHGDSGQGLIGPPLEGNPVALDRARLAALLATGKGAMPPVGRGWDTHQLNALAAYLKQEFASGG